jgi:hypothetical protein
LAKLMAAAQSLAALSVPPPPCELSLSALPTRKAKHLRIALTLDGAFSHRFAKL